MGTQKDSFKLKIRDKFLSALDFLKKPYSHIIKDKRWIELKLPTSDNTLRRWRDNGPPSKYSGWIDADKKRVPEEIKGVYKRIAKYFNIDEDLFTNPEISIEQFVNEVRKANIDLLSDYDHESIAPNSLTTQLIRYLNKIVELNKKIKILDKQEKLPADKIFVPLDVNLKRKYKYNVESSLKYSDSVEEQRSDYAFKGFEKDSTEKGITPWDKAKEDYDQIMLLADPGMGKTTVLQREAKGIAEKLLAELEPDKDITDIEILVHLRLFSIKDVDEDIITEILKALKIDFSPSIEFEAFLKNQIESGKCTFLLDSLDEVPVDDRDNLSSHLCKVYRDTDFNCKIICTSRIVGYSKFFLEDPKELEIRPFNKDQVELYTENWFKHSPSIDKSESLTHNLFLKEIDNKPQLEGLTQVPLLLSLLCKLYIEQKGVLPNKRSEIYEKASLYLTVTHWEKRKIKPQVPRNPKSLLLKYIANHFSFKGVHVDWRDLVPTKCQVILPAQDEGRPGSFHHQAQADSSLPH